MEDNKTTGFDRRSFIRTTATAAAGFIILPSHVISGLGHRMPSDKLNIAGVGIGGRGGGVIRAVSSENIVALCDSLKHGGAHFVEPLESSPWGKMAVVQDFDGNMIALVDR